jgi:hypothetical protein
MNSIVSNKVKISLFEAIPFWQQSILSLLVSVICLLRPGYTVSSACTIYSLDVNQNTIVSPQDV